MLIVEGEGRPIGMSLHGSRAHEVTHVLDAIESVPLRKFPTHLGGDKAYASPRLAKQIWMQHRVHLVAPDKRHYVKPIVDKRRLRRNKRRWMVERCLAWLKAYPRIRRRGEYYAQHFETFLLLACCLIWIKFYE